MGGWWRRALVSPDGVAPSRMVGMSASVLIFPCTINSRSSLLTPAHPGGRGKRAVKRLWWYIFLYGFFPTKSCNSLVLVLLGNIMHTDNTTVLQPLYRTTCVSRHPQSITGGFCCSSFTAHMPLLTATSAFRLGRRR